MKTVIVYALSLFLFVTPALAESSSYIGQKLSVEVENRTVGGISTNSTITDWGLYGSGNIKLREYKDWKGYQGGLQVSEYDFYHIAGMDDLSTKIGSYKQEMGNYRDISLGAIALAIIVAVASPQTTTTVSGSTTTTGMSGAVTAATVVACLGLVSWVYFNRISNENMTPASYAIEVADGYNSTLIPGNNKQ